MSIAGTVALTKQHILILNYEYPPLGGGAGIISEAHARRLAESGHEITVVTCSDRNEYYEEYQEANMKIIRLCCKRKYKYRSSLVEKWDWMQKAKKYLMTMQTVPFDLCMAHFSLPGGLVAQFLKKKKGIPYYVISHGQDIPWLYPKQMFVYHLLLAPVIRRVLRNAENVYVQSEIMYRNVTRFLKDEKTRVTTIANGCYTDWAKEPVDFPVNGQPLRLLFSGRLTGQKRPDKVIQTAIALKEKGVNFQLTIVGDGILKKELQLMARQSGLTDHIHFAGHVPRTDMQQFYSRHHVLLAPSEAEGMSISILEALFSGLYVFCTPVSGNKELIRNGVNGSILPGDPQAFAAAIMAFRDQLPPMQQRKAYQDDFIRTYNWDTIIQHYESTMKHVAPTT